MKILAVDTEYQKNVPFLATTCDQRLKGKIYDLKKEKDFGGLKGSLKFMGFSVDPVMLETGDKPDSELSGKVEALINARLAARNDKDWAEADRIRDQLVEMGVQLKDGINPDTGEIETTWEVKR